MSELPLEHEYVPSEADTGDPAPAVVVLHGRGADEQDLLPVADHLPDELATLSLRAPDPLMGGYTWYELDMSAGGLHESQPEPEGFRRSLDLVGESIDAGIGEYGLDADRLGLLGFSQGGIMTFSLLLEAPERYAWISAHHSYLAGSHADLEPDGLEGKPAFVGAGTADQMIPASRAEDAASRLRELGCAVTFETYPVGHGIGQGELADLVEFVEANH
ncbi:MAG: dienelactone hydrolase family protein [Halobacteriales archaeon]|nr:dienelactone hydrolase family protein [Halobacteriales archaeon]